MIRKTTYKVISFSMIFGALIIILYSCKKTDDAAPSLTIYSPDNYANYSVGDSIMVNGYVTHHSTVQSIKISLWTNDNISVLPAIYIYPGTSENSFDIPYVISDTTLDSGEYQLRITASDRELTTTVYRTLIIEGIDKKVQRLLAVCKQNTNKIVVYSVGNDGSYQSLLNMDFSYVDSDIRSETRQFFILKPQPSKLYAYNLEEFTEEYIYEAQQPYPVFNSIFLTNDHTYLSTGNGNIIGLNESGSSIFVTDVNDDTIPVISFQQNDMLLSYCVRRGGPQKLIRQNYAGTGAFRAGVNTNFSVIQFLDAQDGDVLLLANYTDESAIIYYEIDANVFYDEVLMPPGLIHEAVQVSSDMLLISHDNGIFSYNLDTRMVLSFIPGLDANAIDYDVSNKLLYVAVDNTIKIFNEAGLEISDEIVLPFELLNLHLQYNK